MDASELSRMLSELESVLRSGFSGEIKRRDGKGIIFFSEEWRRFLSKVSQNVLTVYPSEHKMVLVTRARSYAVVAGSGEGNCARFGCSGEDVYKRWAEKRGDVNCNTGVFFF